MVSDIKVSVRLGQADYAALMSYCGGQDCTLSDGLRLGVRRLSGEPMAHTCAKAHNGIQHVQVGVCPTCGDPMAVSIPGEKIREFLLTLLEAGSDEKMEGPCSTCKRGLRSIESVARELSEQSGRPVDEVMDAIEKVANEKGIDFVDLNK